MAVNRIVRRIEKHSLMIDEIINFVSQQSNSVNTKNINRIFIFSSLAHLRLDYSSQLNLLKLLTRTLEGRALFLPAFSYNSRRNLPFNPLELPSPQNGSLSRVAFKENLHDTFRTSDEDFSYIVINSLNLTQQQSMRAKKWREQSFGLQSHHSDLFEDNAQILCIGNGMQDGFTPALHCEAIKNVPYRVFLDFPSQIKTGKIKKYFARNEKQFDNFGKANREKIITKLKQRVDTNFCESKPRANLHLMSFTIHEYMNVLLHELEHDKYYFLH